MTDYLHWYQLHTSKLYVQYVQVMWVAYLYVGILYLQILYNTPQLFITSDWKFSVRNGYETEI